MAIPHVGGRELALHVEHDLHRAAVVADHREGELFLDLSESAGAAGAETARASTATAAGVKHLIIG
jgi:hypothetical protein